MGVQIFNHDPNITAIHLDNPPVNALSQGTLAAFSEAVDTAMADDAIRVVIVTGGGEKAFAAGADLEELYRCDMASGRELVTSVKKIMTKLQRSAKPIIAAINGLAAGGGLELAMSCDIRIADHHAKLGLPECTLGVLPGAGGTQLLPRLTGMGKALELMFSGTLITAEQGLNIGLIDRVVAPGEALNEAVELARKIARNAPRALAEIKAAAYASYSLPLGEGLEAESEGFARLCATADKKEGIEAFKERRPAVYHGR